MPTTSFVYFSTVADGQYQHNHFLILDFTDDTKIADSVTP